MKQQSPPSKALERSCILNKYIFNRITLAFTERGMGPLSVVYHIGRRSGRTYRTPVLASYVGEAIFIPLSYGEDVDWLRNVLAQGGCEILRKKQRIDAINPEVIDAATALPMLPENHRRILERTKEEKFLRLQAIGKK